MSNYSVRSLNIWNIVTVQYHISKEKRKDLILPAPVTITIKFTRILPVPVWPDMSSPAQSFASDMKSPSGRPPSGFWPWQQNFSCSLKIQCFIWLMKYLVRNCFLAISIIYDRWLSEMPTLKLPISGQFWGRHFQVNPSSEMPTPVILNVLTFFLFIFLLLFDVNVLETV